MKFLWGMLAGGGFYSFAIQEQQLIHLKVSSKCSDLTDTQCRQCWVFNSTCDYKIPQVVISYVLIHLPCLIYLMAFIVIVATGFVIFVFFCLRLSHSFLLVEYLNQYQGCFALFPCFSQRAPE